MQVLKMNRVIENINDKYIEITVSENETLTYEALGNSNVKRIFHLKENATLEYLELNLEETESTLEVYQEGTNSNFIGNTLTFGINGKYNFNQNIVHNNKSTNSKITNFGFSFNDANIIYETIGTISKGNSLANCRQLSKGIIISDKSQITSKPVLLIDEFDVNASHGASIGKMSDEELFYLMSRGLSKEDSLKLIISGLINPFIEALDETNQDKYKEIISHLLED